MFKNLKLKNIPIIIMNARITKHSFNKWQNFPNFANQVFGNIIFGITTKLRNFKYLKLLKVKNIRLAGNLKYYGQKNNQDNYQNIKK